MIITFNPASYKRTKHNEINCHFVSVKVLSKEAIIEYTSSNDQLVDIFTVFKGPTIQYIYFKLGALDL